LPSKPPSFTHRPQYRLTAFPTGAVRKPAGKFVVKEKRYGRTDNAGDPAVLLLAAHRRRYVHNVKRAESPFDK
jgi:hypothetical protein